MFLQNYDTSESKLRREFEVYGPVKKVSVSLEVSIYVCICFYCNNLTKAVKFHITILIFLQIVVIHNTINGKPRGYAFIEYEHERDMHCK